MSYKSRVETSSKVRKCSVMSLQSPSSIVTATSDVVSGKSQGEGVSTSTDDSGQLRRTLRNTGKNMQASPSNSATSSLHSPEKFPVPQPPGSSSTVVGAEATSSTTSAHQESGEGGLPVISFPNPVQSAAAAGSARSKRGRKKVIDATVKQKASRRNSKTSEVAFDNVSTSSSSRSSSKKSMAAPIGLVLNDNGEEEYKVEKIINKELFDGVVHYRVKWEGWDSDWNTWEPIENLSNCRDLINEFNAGYQLDSEMNVHVQKGSGESLKLRFAGKPGQDYKVTAATSSPATNDGDRDKTLNEDLDRQFLGPMFRRNWRQSEVPIYVLGSSNIHGDIVHLVRIKTKNDAVNVMEDPYEGLDENNCVMVLAQTFNCYFPQLILKYYEAHAKFVKDTDSDEVKAAKAARIEILRLCRTQGIHVNERRLFQDILQPTNATGTGDFAAAQESDGIIEVGTGFSHLSLSSFKNTAVSVSETDKFGLPESISSTDSDDASSSDEVTKNFMRNRRKPTKRRLLESDEEEHGKNYSDAEIKNVKTKRDSRKAIRKKKPNKEKTGEKALNSKTAETVMNLSSESETEINAKRKGTAFKSRIGEHKGENASDTISGIKERTFKQISTVEEAKVDINENGSDMETGVIEDDMRTGCTEDTGMKDDCSDSKVGTKVDQKEGELENQKDTKKVQIPSTFNYVNDEELDYGVDSDLDDD